MTKRTKSLLSAAALICLTGGLAPVGAQTSTSRDAQAVTLASQAVQALTGGISITDVSVQATANYIAGSDQETGTATLEGHTGYQGRIVLALSGGQRSEIRNGSGAPPQGKRSGPDGVWQATALHNCWTDATWFFPALTIQTALNDSQVSLTYVGQETKAGISVQHIQMSRVLSGQSADQISLIQQLSQEDIYLDATTSLPVAFDYTIHSDGDYLRGYPVEIQFSGWHVANGIQVPSQIQQFLQGSLVLNLTGTTALINTGISQSDFTV